MSNHAFTSCLTTIKNMFISFNYEKNLYYIYLCSITFVCTHGILLCIITNLYSNILSVFVAVHLKETKVSGKHMCQSTVTKHLCDYTNVANIVGHLIIKKMEV